MEKNFLHPLSEVDLFLNPLTHKNTKLNTSYIIFFSCPIYMNFSHAQKMNTLINYNSNV